MNFFVPEVVQTSEMDCGPASLKALLEGHGIAVSYGRLREACQTHVDGTSIDTLEAVAAQLGLDAEQVMLPVDHLNMPEAHALPALVVTLLPNGMTHFVVVWSLQGSLLQIMDPGQGRRWLSWRKFTDDVYLHNFPVAAADWRSWAGSDEFLAPLRQRLKQLTLSDEATQTLIDAALADASWQGLATLDAATRLVTLLVTEKGMERGQRATNLLRRFSTHPQALEVIPKRFWFVRPVSPKPGSEDSEAPQQVLMRGAVLVRIKGIQATAPQALPGEAAPQTLPPELVAALSEKPAHPFQALWNVLRSDGWFSPALLTLALLMAAIGVTIEAVLFQTVTRLAQTGLASEWRTLVMGILLALTVVLFALEAPIAALTWRLARRLDVRLRSAILEKVPRLNDRYFHSRLVSDMVKRVHDLRALRLMPALVSRFLRTVFQLLLTTAGLIVLDPSDMLLTLLFATCVLALSYLTQQILQESEMRLRTYVGALSRFYLDTLLGLLPLRTHAAEQVMRREQESLLAGWAQSSLQVGQIAVALQAIASLLFNAFAVLLIFRLLSRNALASNTVLLQFYWTMNLVVLGQSLVDQVRQYPALRNTMLRVLEILGTPEETPVAADPSPAAATEPTPGVAIDFEAVSVEAGGHLILQDINLHIQPGEHLAVVGQSGAGKSSLVGVLLGWHQPASGACRVEGEALVGDRLYTLRRETAWVDPAIQLWNRSLLQNLIYGTIHAEAQMSQMIEQADLLGVLEHLPEGLQTALGEGGALVSGGEGQRVRLGRALGRAGTRLVILDEPFRGLDREKRRMLLTRARQYWRDATLICITHDIGETQDFDRVLVLDGGRIVEDDAPATLAAQPDSRYNTLLRSEEAVRLTLWQGTEWRHLWLEAGYLSEANGEGKKL